MTAANDTEQDTITVKKGTGVRPRRMVEAGWYPDMDSAVANALDISRILRAWSDPAGAFQE